MNRVRQFRARVDAAAGMLVLAGIILPGAPVRGSEPPQEGRAHIRLQAVAGGSVSVFLDGRKVVTTEALRRFSQPQLFGGVAVSLTKDQQFIMLQGRKQDVVIEAEGLKDWAAKVATNDVLQVRMAPVKRVIDFITPVENRQPVVMRFVDGAKAAMNAGSTARLDYFEDQSYYLSGQGKVETANADGAEIELGIQWPPMAGGPLVSTNGQGGTPHMLRVTPVTRVSITGDLKDAATHAVTSTNRGLAVLVGDRRVYLRRGEAREVVMPNGSVIDFTYPPDAYRLDWRVRKGFFQVTINGFKYWEALVLTDQRGWCQWDAANRAIDIANRTPSEAYPPSQFILCALSGTFTGPGARVTVGPLSLFQYIEIQSFATWAGAGSGNTKLYTASQRLPLDLGKGNLLVRSGLAAGAKPAIPKLTAQLAWNPNQPLDVTNPKGGARIPPNTRQTVSLGDASQLDVNYATPGTVSITAIADSCTLEPKLLRGWTFDVQAGDGVLFNFDQEGGLFIVQANQKNAIPVRVRTPGQVAPMLEVVPMLEAGNSMTFVLERNGILFAGGSGSLIFFESAGADTQSGSRNIISTFSLLNDRTRSIEPYNPEKQVFNLSRPDGTAPPLPPVYGSPIDSLIPHILEPRILEPPVTVSGLEPSP